MSVFEKPSMDLIHIWHGDKYLFKILRGTIPIPVHDLKVKVTDLKLLHKSFAFKFLQCQFLQSLMDLRLPCNWYWCILHGTIPTPVYGPKVRVTDLEFLC